MGYPPPPIEKCTNETLENKQHKNKPRRAITRRGFSYSNRKISFTVNTQVG